MEQPGCAFNFKTSQCREGNVKSASPEELFRADDDVDQSKDDSLAIFRLAEPTPGCNGDDWKALERILAVDGCLKGSLVVVVSVIGEVPDLMVLHEAPNLLIREVIGQTEISQSLEFDGQKLIPAYLSKTGFEQIIVSFNIVVE